MINAEDNTMLKKIMCAVLCAAMLLSLCSCSGGTVIASYKGNTLDSAMYSLHLAIEKEAIVQYYYTYYSVDISDTPEFWDEYYDKENNITWTDYINIDFCNMLVAMAFCEEHDISLSDEDVKKQIDDLLADYVESAGSKELLTIKLSEYGADYDMLEKYLYSYQCISLMQDYLADNGTITVTDDDVYEYLGQYWNFDYILFEAVDANNDPIIDESITEDEALAYFLSDFVRVRHILYKTADMDDDEKAALLADVTDKMNKITSGEAEYSDYEKETEDSNVEYTFTHDVMVDEFEDAAYDMEIGELRIVETSFGYHLMLKEELPAEEFEEYSDDVIAAMSALKIRAEAEKLLENIKSGDAEFAASENGEYEFCESIVVGEGDEKNFDADLFEFFKTSEIGDMYLYPYRSYGYYIFRRVDFDEKDLSTYGDSVREILVGEKFTDYMTDLIASVEINQEEMDKYDIKTVASFLSD